MEAARDDEPEMMVVKAKAITRQIATGKEGESDGEKKGKNGDGGKGVQSGAAVRNLMLQLSAERRLTGGHIGADGSAAEVHLGDRAVLAAQQRRDVLAWLKLRHVEAQLNKALHHVVEHFRAVFHKKGKRNCQKGKQWNGERGVAQLGSTAVVLMLWRTSASLLTGGDHIAATVVTAVKVPHLVGGDAAHVAARVGKEFPHQAVSQWTARAAHHRHQLAGVGGHLRGAEALFDEALQHVVGQPRAVLEPAESEAAEEGQMRKQKRVAATVAITRQSALEFIVVVHQPIKLLQDEAIQADHSKDVPDSGHRVHQEERVGEAAKIDQAEHADGGDGAEDDHEEEGGQRKGGQAEEAVIQFGQRAHFGDNFLQ
ncbi:hypothetical protein TYRP_021269 [Tyrophagus putrescentiae]|nr:hypothetical protein TYRP_021269 [Tyrophagus putrescentiae]